MAGAGRPGPGSSSAAAATAAAVLVAAAGCWWGEGGSGGGGTSGPGELRVLAGSELADMEPLLERAAEETGVTVRMEYTGTLDGVEQVVGGRAEDRYDAVWFSSNRYLNLYPEGRGALRQETPVMASPVVLGVGEDKAGELGWEVADGAVTGVSWSGIAEAVDEGDLDYAMTGPAASNSGFSALVGVAAALADTGAALEPSDIDGVTGELRGFFAGQTLTAGSSGWLAEEYADRVRDPGGRPAPDAMINYESVLMSLEGDGIPGGLLPVHPTDGAVTADYPLSLLESASDGAAADYDALVEHLLSPEVQREIAADTRRRPMEPEALPEDARGAFPALPELPFPATAESADALIAAYYDRIRKPARTVYVLDVSSSMAGERIEGLRSAVHTLAGGDAGSIAGRFQRFYGRERVTVLPFSSSVHGPESFEVPEEEPDAMLASIRDHVDGLRPEGGTAGYDALADAYALLEEEDTEDVFTSVVLMTDGEINAGRTYDDFAADHAGLPDRLRAVPVFPVVFGESDPEEMEDLASLTGGRAFDAQGDDEASLDEAFREIRGYQ
ncbi:substrate-binding domain-containing protein [Nocardiopsis suaedae]|uniref:Substrate-binding domain-containing protein n=1 Tax=Nocardiopsis suaedae TaxID=3018444 RepID=A0ABT4TPP9_9ACTN|nr:substrate-binding domain-containing protein [Nocardiopsis suaedae]MDA2806650.1 substrate-binding domain-containing protein [Nocardiopsis suaedae]